MEVVYLACIFCHFSFLGDEGLGKMGTVHIYVEIIDVFFCHLSAVSFSTDPLT